MRSYQCDCVNDAAGAEEYCCVTSTGPNAFGANSAPGEGECERSSGDVGIAGIAGTRCGVDGFCDWFCGRWMFAVGGGAMPVRGPCGCGGF
jgi:hypothetical protein